jgi:sec-independent protein translocase protein TatC
VSEPEFPSAADDEGGPRKSFWEHLSDLRTAVLRSGIAIAIALVICLFLTSRIVDILTYPLQRMSRFQADHPTVTLVIGATQLGPFPVTREQFPGLPPGKNPHAVFHLSTVQIGDQQVAALKLDPLAAANPPLEVRLHNLSPAEAFMTAFHVAMYAAVVLSSPFWLYFLGGFIVPAFRRKEREAIGQWLFWGVILAATGVLLTYFVLLPVALRASIKYSELLGFSASDWQADEYIGFVCKFIFGMGIGFQFPLVVLLLVKMGLVTHRQLGKYRRHVVVVCLILGALLTTPEVITQVAMAMPLYLLYEICIWIAWYWDWKKRRARG